MLGLAEKDGANKSDGRLNEAAAPSSRKDLVRE